MKLRSMTGFARVRGAIAGIEVVISIKSVNHRGLDLHFYTGPELDPLEATIRATVKRNVARGHLDVRVQVATAGSNGSLSIDQTKLSAYVATFRQAAAQFGIPGEPDLNAAFRFAGVISDSPSVELPAGFEEPFIALLEEALQTLNQFRSREGAELGAFLLERNSSIQAAAESIGERRATLQPALQARMRDRLNEVLAGVNLDPQRIAQEAAILADRSDIGEEIERLRIHARQIAQILQEESEAGKKLDFVLQEMNRETNTILSKTSGIGEAGLQITELALSVKSDIEKLREQVLNLE